MSEAIKLTRTDPMLREINSGLMVDWINRDLAGRAGHDVRKSVVLYDAHRMFATAFDADGLPGIAVKAGHAESLATLHAAGIHFWSVGIV
jgi:hypothetical protein